MSDQLPNTGELTRPATAAHNALLLPPSRPTVSAPAPKAKESLPLSILRGVSRRWKIAVPLGVMLALGIGAGVWFLMPPPKPTATAKLYVPQKPQGKIGDHPDPPLERATQVEWIRSRLVLSAALRSPEVANLPILKDQADPVDWLVKSLVVEFSGPEILRISLTSNEPEQAKKIVDAVTKAYLDEVVNKSSTDRTGRLQRLKEYTAKMKSELTELQHQIKDTSQKGGVYDSEKRRYLQERLKRSAEAAERQLTTVASALMNAEAKEKALLKEANTEPSKEDIDAGVNADLRVKDSAATLKKKSDEVGEIRAKAADTEAARKIVKKYEDELEILKKDHEALQERIRPEIREKLLKEAQNKLADELKKARADIASLRQERDLYKSEVDEYTKTLSDILVNNDDLFLLEFQRGQTEKLLSGGLLAKQQLELEQDAPPRVVLMEDATVSLVDAAKRKRMLAAGGSLAGFLLALGMVGLIESLFRRVESADAVYQQLGLRVVGTVPTPKAGPLKWLTNNDTRTNAMLAEAIACTRTMLLHGEGSATHRVLLITSPTSGEGKTSLAVQLAVSIALAGHRTLLIDGDLRNPSVHERFGMPYGPGLSEILRGEVSLLEVVRESTVASLDVIPAGQWTPETPQALVTAPLGQLFAMWREQYEFVILDSSPVLPITDALLLARHTDGVILSLMQGVSRMSQAEEVRDRFVSLGVNVIGAIVNGTPARTYGAADKYYYPTAAATNAATNATTTTTTTDSASIPSQEQA